MSQKEAKKAKIVESTNPALLLTLLEFWKHKFY
jgi:hypothetical protein